MQSLMEGFLNMPPPCCPLVFEGSINSGTWHLSHVSKAEPEDWDDSDSRLFCLRVMDGKPVNCWEWLKHPSAACQERNQGFWSTLDVWVLLSLLNSGWQSIETPSGALFSQVLFLPLGHVAGVSPSFRAAASLFSSCLKFPVLHPLSLFLKSLNLAARTAFHGHCLPGGIRYQILKSWKI